MKFAAAFLVLFMVIVKFEPRECFFGMLFTGSTMQELDKCAVDYNPKCYSSAFQWPYVSCYRAVISYSLSRVSAILSFNDFTFESHKANFVLARMKFTATFLVMFIFVLMVEPGECGWKKWFKKATHVGKHVGKAALDAYLGEKQELDKRAVDEEPSAIVFD
ncbi:unnamed protein product [Pleuronectes platessa]|uniref:Uncharacterized protein n=2 Tax=Pleuronectidae TaxID=8256 RepID=A0A9N7YBF3_PLEPL|nr:unnamed protein product [Pleuronectes platessa]